MKNAFKSIVVWIYAMFFTVQILSLASSFIIQNEFASTAIPFFRFWKALGTQIFENWLPFSILFVMIFVGGILDEQLKMERNISKQFFNFIFLCINLILCNRLYNTSAFYERIEFLGKNIWSVLGFLVAVILVILIGNALKKARAAQAIRAEELSKLNPVIGDSQQAYAFQNNEHDEFLMKQYPIFYIWNNLKYNYSRNKQVKQEIQSEYNNAKAKSKAEAKAKIADKKYNEKAKSYDPKTDGINNVSSIFSIILVVILNIALFVSLISYEDFSESKIYKILKTVKKFFIDDLSFKNFDEAPILNWLLDFGCVFLITIVFVLINFLIYFTIRVFIYFIVNLKEDDALVKRFSRQIKTFFFDLADDTMRLLLFLPDFLEVTEDILLNTDIDEKVKKRFEEFDSSCNNSSSSYSIPGQESTNKENSSTNPEESETNK